MMNAYSFSMLGFSFGVMLIALLALVKRRDSVSIRFLFFSITVCGWSFPLAFWITQQYSYDNTLALERFAHGLAIWAPVTWTHFVFQFIGKKEPFRNFYALNYGIAFFLFLTSRSSLFISGLHPILDFKYFPTLRPAHHFFMFVWFILVPYAFTYLIRAYFNSQGQSRYQLKYLVIGTVIGFTGAMGTILPMYNIPFPQYILLAMPLYPLLTGIALIKHGLFDVQQIADAFRRDKLAAIGTLTASINHEIRNPLYVIQGLAQSEIENVKDNIYPDEKTALQKSLRVHQKTAEQATRAMEIMGRFSLFAKREVSEQVSKLPVDLDQVLTNILPLVRHEFELDKIEFKKGIPHDFPQLHADPQHMEEVFFNLIVNACQAIKNAADESLKDKEKIEISAEQHNGALKIKLEDNGPGIPQNRLKQIFEPFYTTKEEGTGLGLYITKQLIEKNGGRISVKSQPGKGTTFILEFKR